MWIYVRRTRRLGVWELALNLWLLVCSINWVLCNTKDFCMDNILMDL